MDVLQSGLAADALLRQNAERRRRAGGRGEAEYYADLDRAMKATRRLVLTLAVASASVLVAVVASSVARDGVLLAGVVQ